MIKNKYFLIAFALLLMISCKKENLSNPSSNTNKNSGCLLLTATEEGLLQTEFSYDENDRISTCLSMSFTDESSFLKFEYKPGFCFTNLYYISNNSSGQADIQDTFKLNSNGFFEQYYNKSDNVTLKAFYNNSTQLLDSLVEYQGRTTTTPVYYTYYTYDSKNRMTEKDVYLSTTRQKVRVTTVEYNNTPNKIGIIAGNPISGFYNNSLNLIASQVNLTVQYFLSNNYRTDGLPIKESVQGYVNGLPFSAPVITQFNYFTNSSNQVDSILPIKQGREYEGLKLEFRCK